MANESLTLGLYVLSLSGESLSDARESGPSDFKALRLVATWTHEVQPNRIRLRVVADRIGIPHSALPAIAEDALGLAEYLGDLGEQTGIGLHGFGRIN